MTAHESSIEIHTESNLLPNQPFFSWLKTQTTLFITQIIGILGFITLLVSLIYYSTNVVHRENGTEFVVSRNLKLIIDYAHIVLIVIFIIALLRVLDDNDRGSYRVSLVFKRVFGKYPDDHEDCLDQSQKRLRDFKRWFLWFWCALLLLYVVFAFKHNMELTRAYIADRPPDVGNISIRGEVVNVVIIPPVAVNAGAENSSQPAPSNSGSNNQGTAQEDRSPLERWLDVTDLALNNISLWLIFGCFIVMYFPRTKPKLEKRHLILSCAGVVVSILILLSLFVRHAASPNSTALSALSGTLNAIAFALLVARLDSKLIGLPSHLVSVLYSYSAIQPFYVIFGSKATELQNIQTAVLIVAFISKVYFFLIVIYILQTGRMLNYFYCLPELNRRVHSACVETSSDSSENGSTQNEPVHKHFFQWLGRKDQRMFLYLCIGGFLPPFVLLGRAFIPGQPGPNLVVYVAHILFLVVIVCILLVKKKVWTKEDESEDEDNWIKQSTPPARLFKSVFGKNLGDEKCKTPQKTSKSQLKQFWWYFLLFWVGTLLLYLLFVGQQLHIPILYTAPYAEQSGSDGLPVEVAASKLFFHFFTFAMNNAGCLAVFCCFVVMYLPSDHSRWEERRRLLRNYSAFVVVLITLSFWLLLFLVGLTESKLNLYHTYFAALSGMLNAVALSLLIARLDSKLIGIPSSFIAILYVYSAVQPLFVLFDLEVEGLDFKTIQLVALILAFILKIYFFLMVAYTIETGRMRNYLVCFPFLNRRMDSIFDNQFEIKVYREGDYSFRISILKKNALQYFTDTTAGSREECDRRVHHLRELMKDEHAYSKRYKNGTHWVTVVGLPYCQSISLRSEEEADELIDESKEKIPYCKYDRG
jgi:hypothetical protein